MDLYTGDYLDNTTVSAMPSGRAYLTAAGVAQTAVSCFGSQHCTECCEESECVVYSDEGGWSNPRHLPGYNPPQVLYREYSCGVVVGEKVWIVGGLHANQSLISVSSVEIFDPFCTNTNCDYWVEGPDLPQPLHSTCGVHHEGDLYVLGGKGEGVWPLDNILQLQDNIWTNVGSLPVGRYGHGCATFQGKIFVSGGYSGDGRLGRVDVYNTDTRVWDRAGELVIQRNYHQMVLVNNQLTVLGGYGAPLAEYWAPRDVASIEEYHPDIDRWVLHNLTLSSPRRSFGVAIITN